MLADDFSFPVVKTPISHHFSVDPTSFWCVSPQSFSGHSHAPAGEDYDDGADDRGRRSSSGGGGGGGGGCCSPTPTPTPGKDEEEEKMDVLWEDFNEELNSRRVSSKKEVRDVKLVSPSPEAAVVEMEMSRRTRGGVVVAHKKHSVVVVLKVLKKMLKLHNSPNFFTRRKPDRCYLNR